VTARDLARTRDAVLAGEAPAALPRDVVSASWRRSLAAHVDPEHGGPPLIYEHREVTRVRDGHPLAAVLPLLRDTLVSIADEAMHMMIVTDAQGHILWREGQRDVLRTAERVGLVEGTRWSEDSIGTNAMGTALAADRAVQIHSAEHLVRAARRTGRAPDAERSRARRTAAGLAAGPHPAAGGRRPGRSRRQR
jgi:transcriptional regulator of acetoin/glycerol metabolism